MRIVTKISLGFILLIAGYVLAVTMTDLRTRNSEVFLQGIDGSAFPCANAAQSTISIFKQQRSLFQDAVVFGEASAIERAESLRGEVSDHLRRISGDDGIAQVRRDAAQDLLEHHGAFVTDAVAVYTRMVKNDAGADLPPLAAGLKTRGDHLQTGLVRLLDDLNVDLKQAIETRKQQLRNDRITSEVIFVIVLTAAATLIATIVLKLSSRLRLLIGASAKLSAGDYATSIQATGNDEVSQLAHAFEAMRTAIDTRNRELERFNASLDALVRERTSELEQRNAELSTQIAERQRAERSLRLVESAIIQIDEGVVIAPADELPTSAPEYLNPGFFKTLGLPPAAGFTAGLTSLFGQAPIPDQFRSAWTSARAGTQQTAEVSIIRADHSDLIIEWLVAPLRDADGKVSSVVSILRDLTERKRLEAQRHQGQKMESVGQLAAGVAHEINTPIQFIGDNLRFLGDSFADLTTVLDAHAKLLTAARSGAVPDEAITATDAAAKRADVDFLAEEIPKAIGQSLEGITRVAEIVRAMKEFSHPDQGEKKPSDLNKAILTTLTVARSEYKYVADLVTELADDLPAVPCIVGEINQVVLNLVVNAAHAISDVVAKDGGKGTITVSTRHDGDFAEVRIRDSGTGIPESARAKIFDPFFTTKAVGKGTGQGLYIAHTVVTKKHGGTLAFETELGTGTTFIIRLPIVSP